jgi:hypothetical protein
MTQYYFAADLSPVLDINSKLIWREVRKHGIAPQMVVNKYGIQERDVVRLERALGVKVPRKQAPKPRQAAPAAKGRPLTHKPAPRKTAKAASWDTMPMEAKRTVSEATLAANRARIAQAQRVKPRYEQAGDVPEPWQWSKGL